MWLGLLHFNSVFPSGLLQFPHTAFTTFYKKMVATDTSLQGKCDLVHLFHFLHRTAGFFQDLCCRFSLRSPLYPRDLISLSFPIRFWTCCHWFRVPLTLPAPAYIPHHANSGQLPSGKSTTVFPLFLCLLPSSASSVLG